MICQIVFLVLQFSLRSDAITMIAFGVTLSPNIRYVDYVDDL